MAFENNAWNPSIQLDAIKIYGDFAKREIARVTRNLEGLSQDDLDALVRKPALQVSVMQEADNNNCAFLDKIAALIKEAASTTGAQGSSVDTDIGPTTKTVQSMLQTFVREWSEEGLQERKECVEVLLGALDTHLGSQRDHAVSSGAVAPRVLFPGCELARLPFEASLRGYDCEGCEMRALLYFGTELVRKEFTRKGAHCIQPFNTNTCNRFKAEDNVRKVEMPEVDVPKLPPVVFGDFAQIYDFADKKASFDAVVTAFALDASPNVLRFIRTVAHVVRPGGLWTNFGPLAYDQEHDEHHGHGVELSWEELKFAMSHFFELQEDKYFDAFHSSNMQSMMQLQYSCVFFTAVRNSTPAEGIGEEKKGEETKK